MQRITEVTKDEYQSAINVFNSRLFPHIEFYQTSNDSKILTHFGQPIHYIITFDLDKNVAEFQKVLFSYQPIQSYDLIDMSERMIFEFFLDCFVL